MGTVTTDTSCMGIGWVDDFFSGSKYTYLVLWLRIIMAEKSVEEVISDLGISCDRHHPDFQVDASTHDKKRAYDSVVRFLNSKVVAAQQQAKIDSSPNSHTHDYFLAGKKLAEQLLEQGFSDENFNLLFGQRDGGIFEDPHFGIFRLVQNSNFQWDSFDWEGWEVTNQP